MTLRRWVCTVPTASNGANNFKTKNLRVSRGYWKAGLAFDGRRACCPARRFMPPLPHLTETVRPNSLACVTGSCARVSARVLMARAWRKDRSEEHPQDDWSGHLRRRARCCAAGAGDRHRECGQRRQLGRRRVPASPAATGRLPRVTVITAVCSSPWAPGAPTVAPAHRTRPAARSRSGWPRTCCVRRASARGRSAAGAASHLTTAEAVLGFCPAPPLLSQRPLTPNK